MKALILAAGMGTRLLPHTKIIPKPLFPLNGIPILKLVIDRLTDLGCTDIIINTHHLHEKIENFIKMTKFSTRVETRYEPELLDTGGAIKNVKDFMDGSDFFVINSDIISDIDLKKVWNFHTRGNWPVTLVMHDFPKFNKIKINEKNFVTGFLNPEKQHTHKQINGQKPVTRGRGNTSGSGSCGQLLAFTGIQVLSSDIFDHMPHQKKFSSIEVYNTLAGKGNYVKAYICKNQYWNDIGTIESYEKQCIVDIASQYFNSCNHRHNPCDFRIEKLNGDGSDRKWFRVKLFDNLKKSRVVCNHKSFKKITEFRSLIMALHGIAPENSGTYTDSNDRCDQKKQPVKEIDSFIAIGRHLFSVGIPVPEIYQYDTASGIVMLEDLGDIHFQQIINNLESDNEITGWYKKICDYLIDFSIKGIQNFNTSWTFQTDSYTRELILENECKYFTDAFIRSYLKHTVKFNDLKQSFEFIAENALKYAFTGLMHRDMQSRNIMVKNKKIFFIDFQAARKGPVQYDLASLLIDPYVDLNIKTQDEILKYCALKINGLTGFDREKFIKGFRFCAVTRNMQILGAFSYLSMVKGKKYFENYIPCALNTLSINIDILNLETKGQLEPVKKLLDCVHNLVFPHLLKDRF